MTTMDTYAREIETSSNMEVNVSGEQNGEIYSSYH